MILPLRTIMKAAFFILISLSSPSFATTFSGNLDLTDPPPEAVIAKAIKKWLGNDALELAQVGFINSGEQQSLFGKKSVINLGVVLVAREDLYLEAYNQVDGAPTVYAKSAPEGSLIEVSGRFEGIRVGADWETDFVVKNPGLARSYYSLSDMDDPHLIEGSAEYQAAVARNAEWKSSQLTGVQGHWVGMFSCGHQKWNIDSLVVDDATQEGTAMMSLHLASKREPLKETVTFKLDEKQKMMQMAVRGVNDNRQWHGPVESGPGFMKWSIYDCDPAYLYPEDNLPSEVVEYREELAARLKRISLGQHDALLAEGEKIATKAVVDKVAGNMVEMTITHPQRTSGGVLKANQEAIQSKLWVRFADFPEFPAAIYSKRVDGMKYGVLVMGGCDYTPKLHENGAIEVDLSNGYGCHGKWVIQ